MAKKRNYVNNPDFLAALIDYDVKRQKALAEGVLPPVASNYIAQCILQICEKTSNKSNYCGYCVDDQTEALTKRGFVRYDEISLDDEILSLDISTNVLKWSKIISVYRNDFYDGKMHWLTGSTIDALVTPNHKFYTEDDGLVPVDKIRVKDHIITNGLPLEVSAEKYSDELVKLVGWFVTEGSSTFYERKKDGKISFNISIYQSELKNPDNCRDIENCIQYLTDNLYPFDRKVKERKLKNDGMRSYYCGIKLADELQNIAPNKIINYDFIFSLSLRQRHLLIDTMIKADGHNKQFFQKDKEMSDRFMVLCYISGYAVNSNYRKWKTKFCVSEGWTVSINNRDRSYVEKINFHGGKRGRGGKWGNTKLHEPTVNYKGVVWCPETEFGTFVCRRGKKVYVTGNSWKDEMVDDAIEKCIAGINVFDHKRSDNPFAFFTRIAMNAFIARINTEKKEIAIKHKNAISNIDEYLVSSESEASSQIIDDYDKFVEEKKMKIEQKKREKENL